MGAGARRGADGGSLNPRAMLATRSLLPLALCAAALLLASAAPHSPAALARQRRQLAEDDALQPLDDAGADEQTREKRKLEGVTQAKLGIKNAVLGFVFGKINSLIDAKTRLVANLDQKNIELNKQYGIEPPQNGIGSLSGVVSQVFTGIQPKLQFLAPKIQAVTGLITGASGGGAAGASTGTTWRRRASSRMRSTDTTSSTRTRRQATDDIPEFDRNKVSLDLPGNLFGPSVSLLIRTTKIIGDVIQNSAVRYQTFLRLFRPLFRGQFEIKGLDPVTTTTTTTTRRPPTSSTAATSPTAADADNEVRRRRSLPHY